MSNHMFRILSIDFDFFQDATEEQLHQYPDGIDLPTNLSSIVWASHYVGPGSELIKSVTINKPLFQQMWRILRHQSSDIPVLITNSHVHAYNFILEHYHQKTIDLYNVDMHHDMINNNPELDCGNWIRCLKQEVPNTKIHWIARDVSMKCYHLAPNEIPVLLDFETIKDVEFDAIFLCRSDNWTPPHLDEYFHHMYTFCASRFNDVKIQPDVAVPRDMKQLIEQEEQIRNTMKKFTNHITNKEDENHGHHGLC